jgi:hypothetical protein
MKTFQDCKELVKELKVQLIEAYPYIKWSDAKIMKSVKTPKEYLNPSKQKILHQVQYELLFKKLEKMTTQKIYKHLKV